MEQDLRDHPEDREEIVFELALAHKTAGDLDAAERVLREVVASGGELAPFARVDLAGLYLESGREELAEAELTSVRRSRPPDPDPYCMAAELLAAHDRDREALRWFDIALVRFGDLATRAPDNPGLSYVSTVLWQRRDIRHRLGLVPDELDEAAPDTPDLSAGA